MAVFIKESEEMEKKKQKMPRSDKFWLTNGILYVSFTFSISEFKYVKKCLYQVLIQYVPNSAIILDKSVIDMKVSLSIFIVYIPVDNISHFVQYRKLDNVV